MKLIGNKETGYSTVSSIQKPDVKAKEIDESIAKTSKVKKSS